MHQVRKGNQWYFGMKAHVGVDRGNEADSLGGGHRGQPVRLQDAARAAARRGDRSVWRSGLPGPGRGARPHAPKAENRIDRLSKTKLKQYLDCKEENRIKSKTRTRVEHVFAVMKLQFGFVKVRFRGLAKNLNRLETTCALINLCTARKHLLAVHAQSHG